MPARATLHAATTLALVLGLLALPVLHGVGSPPEHDVRRVAVTDWVTGERWQTGSVAHDDVVLLAADLTAHPDVQIRSRQGSGWTAWQALSPPGDHAPDPGRVEAAHVRTGASEPAWVGAAAQVQVRVPAGAPRPRALEAVASQGGDGLAWRPPTGGEPGAADALSVWPPMVPRSAWDPGGECQPRRVPDYAPSVERVYVHHTAIFPEYQPDETDDIVRAICTFHVEGRGFDDIGYNFLIDRYGGIYQGRSGGILRPVVGAHASGFNTGSAGIAIIGNFDDHAVPPATLESLDRLIAWLFEWHGIDPYALTAHVSTGGATTPHPAGQSVLLPTIVGHRQTATNTSCPGDLLFEHVHGGDPAVHRVARLLRDENVEVGEPAPPAQQQAAVTDGRGMRAPPPTMASVLRSVAAAVRTLATRRLDDRLVPAFGGRSR
ncbi:MAG TPA: N-acetylmuramoyl-L-alanine amidase [Nitriliruptorales bacterium]